MRGPEAKENWIAARIDELMDDAEFRMTWVVTGFGSLKDFAHDQATREHSALMADLEEERINAAREY